LNRPSKVCFILQNTGHIYGAQRATLDLLEGLQAHGAVQPHVILFQELRVDSEVKDFERSLRDLGVAMITPPVAGAYCRKLVKVIRDYTVTHGIEVVHSVGYKADLHAWRASGGGRQFKVASTVHGWFFLPDWKEQVYYHINLWTLKRIAKVIVLSRFYEKALREKGMLVQRIPSGFRGITHPPEDRTYAAGMLTRFTGEKNISMFVRAAKRVVVEQPDARFMIAGDGPDRDAIARQIADAGLAEHIELPGYLPREAFFSHVQVPVLCSNIENLPYTVMEAMDCALPVVATRVGGLPDLIDDGVTGYLVEADDDKALAARLLGLMADKEMCLAFGLAAKKKLERDFCPEVAIAEHVRMYEGLGR